MNSVKWFIDEFEKMTGERAWVKEVGFEAVEFYQEEIGPEFIPVENLERLPDTMLIETMVYVDEEENEWNAGIVLCGKAEDGLYTFWTKNGESISRQFTNEIERDEEK